MGENMVRTQVYLPREMYNRLQQRASQHDLTLAMQIRAAGHRVRPWRARHELLQLSPDPSRGYV